MKEEARAVLHDTGYHRYEGGRLPPSRRFRVIARNVIWQAWRMKRAAVKIPIFLSLGTVIGVSVVIAVTRRFIRDEPPPDLSSGGVPVLGADWFLFHSIEVFELWGFILSLLVACGAVAADLRLGAFQFYFARPLRARDYVVGKLLGLFVVVGAATFAGPVLVAVLRVALSESWAEVVASADMIPRCAAIGLALTLGWMLPAAGIGALIGRTVPAQALFVIYAVPVSNIAEVMSEETDQPWLQLISTQRCLTILSRRLCNYDPLFGDPPWWQAALAVFAVTALGYAIIARRVRQAETAGLVMGG